MARDLKELLHRMIDGSTHGEAERLEMHEDVDNLNQSTGKTTVKEDSNDDGKSDEPAKEYKPS